MLSNPIEWGTYETILTQVGDKVLPMVEGQEQACSKYNDLMYSGL